jgi:hypothetical protein
LKNVTNIFGSSAETRLVSENNNQIFAVTNVLKTSGVVRVSLVGVAGDSGGGFVLVAEGRGFVFGTDSGNGSTYTQGPYLSFSEWTKVNDHVLARQVGNITDTDPVNMVVGSAVNVVGRASKGVTVTVAITPKLIYFDD